MFRNPRSRLIGKKNVQMFLTSINELPALLLDSEPSAQRGMYEYQFYNDVVFFIYIYMYRYTFSGKNSQVEVLRFTL